MEIKITECLATRLGEDVLKDLAEYEDVSSWLQAYANGTSHIKKMEFLDFAIILDKKPHWIVNGAEEKMTAEELEKLIKKVKAFPKNGRMIPNDTMRIVMDGFEQELFVYLEKPNF